MLSPIFVPFRALDTPPPSEFNSYYLLIAVHISAPHHGTTNGRTMDQPGGLIIYGEFAITERLILRHKYAMPADGRRARRGERRGSLGGNDAVEEELMAMQLRAGQSLTELDMQPGETCVSQTQTSPARHIGGTSRP